MAGADGSRASQDQSWEFQGLWCCSVGKLGNTVTREDIQVRHTGAVYSVLFSPSNSDPIDVGVCLSVSGGLQESKMGCVRLFLWSSVLLSVSLFVKDW